MKRLHGIPMVMLAALAGCPAATVGVPAATWTAPAALPNLGASADGVVGTNLAVLPGGSLVAIYPVRSGGYSCTQATSTDGGKTWTAVPFVPQPGAHGLNVAVDRKGKLHSAWGFGKDLYYAASTDGGATWSSSLKITAAHFTATTSLITVDRKLRVHVMYFDGYADDASRPGEVYYVRSSNGGASWDAPRLLSKDDGRQSLYPRADFSGVEGDRLAIVWRDQRNSTWDIYGAFSEDGGANWTEQLVAGGDRDQWDPMSLVDRKGVVHVSYMDPTPGDLIDTQIVYGKGSKFSDGSFQFEWSPLTEEQSRFPFFAYDAGRDILWLYWKDERDMDHETGNRQSDIAGRFSKDGGTTWSDLEFVTDNGTIETRYPAFCVGEDGIVHALYSRGESGEEEPYTVYYTHRTSVP